MATIWKGITNGGGNRFFEKGDSIMVAGADVGGRQKVTADLLADLWGADLLKTGDVTGDGANPKLEGSGTTVRISGADTSGAYRFSFDSEKEATKFLAFLDAVNDEGKLDDML